MPNELNLGRVVAEIALESQEAQDTADDIREILKSIGIEGKQADQILKQCFSDTSSFKKYRSELDIIAAKIEAQKKKLEELERVKSKEPLYKSDYTAIEKATAAFDNEKIKLMQLEKQFDNTAAAQENYVKKQAQSVANVADKQKYKDASAGINIMSSSLRTLDNIAPGVVVGLSDIITQVNIAKRAFKNSATPALAWGTAIAAGVGIVANLIVSGLSQIQQKQEETRRQAAQLAEEYKEESQTLRDLADDYMVLKTKIDTTSLSHDEESSVKKQLLQVQEKMVEMYGEEARKLDLVNGNIDEQIDKLKQLAVAQAKVKEQELFADIQTAERDLKQLEDYSIGPLKINDNTKSYLEKSISDIFKKYNAKVVEDSGGNSIGGITGNKQIVYTLDFEVGEAKEKLSNVFDEINNLKQNLLDDGVSQEAIKELDNMLAIVSARLKSASTEEIENMKSIVEQAEQLRETIDSNGANLFPKSDSAEYQIRSIQQYTTAVNDLGSAYASLHEGKKLDLDTALQMIETYPEFAQAIASGTLSLSDQEAVVKQLFEAKRTEALQSIEMDRQKIESLREATQETIDMLNTQIAAYAAGGGFGNIYGQLAEAKNSMEEYNEQLNQLNARTKAYKSISISDYLPEKKTTKKDDRNEALQQELKLLEHRKALNQLSAQDEIAWLERINTTYSKNSDEQMDMEKRLYNARKALQEAEEKAASEALNTALKGIEDRKSLNKITSAEEIAQLEHIRQTYRMNAEEAMSLEIKLYNLKKTLREERTDKLDNVADGVIEALKNKYEKQKEYETDRINQSIKSWQDWEDKTVSAIQGQIDALDELAKAQDSEDKRQEYETKRQATALQLAYEKDDYNRKQFQKELNKLDQEEAKRLEAEAREKQKEELQKQMDAVKEESDKQQDLLKQRQDALNEQYEKLTSSFAIEQEAQKTIMEKGMNGVVNLIKSFAPEFNLAGKTLAEKLFEGFASKNWDIDAYSNWITSHANSAYVQAQRVASEAAENFWRSRNEYNRQTGMTTAGVKAPDIYMTVNFNQPVESPVDMQRKLRQVEQDIARQIMK